MRNKLIQNYGSGASNWRITSNKLIHKNSVYAIAYETNFFSSFQFIYLFTLSPRIWGLMRIQSEWPIHLWLMTNIIDHISGNWKLKLHLFVSYWWEMSRIVDSSIYQAWLRIQHLFKHACLAFAGANATEWNWLLHAFHRSAIQDWNWGKRELFPHSMTLFLSLPLSCIHARYDIVTKAIHIDASSQQLHVHKRAEYVCGAWHISWIYLWYLCVCCKMLYISHLAY